MPTIKNVVHTVPNVTDVQSIRLTESFNASTSQAIIEADDTSLSLGNSINFQIGFDTDKGKVFQGYVREIRKSLPESTVEIVCEDELSKAIEYFIAADNPEEPFSRSNISTQDLVEDILNLADITNYASDVPLSVTWGTRGSVEFNLVTAWQAAKSISDALAWHIFADRNGQVNLVERRPYPDTGDTTSFTWTRANKDLLVISKSSSVDNLRNRVVVYGKEGVTATASASSPHLPSGFFKTAVIATPIIDNNSLAQTVADHNLEQFNRLTEKLTINIEGNWQVKPRLIAEVTESFTETSGDWFIYSVEHVIDASGFRQNVTLTR